MTNFELTLDQLAQISGGWSTKEERKAKREAKKEAKEHEKTCPDGQRGSECPYDPSSIFDGDRHDTRPFDPNGPMS